MYVHICNVCLRPYSLNKMQSMQHMYYLYNISYLQMCTITTRMWTFQRVRYILILHIFKATVQQCTRKVIFIILNIVQSGTEYTCDIRRYLHLVNTFVFYFPKKKNYIKCIGCMMWHCGIVLNLKWSFFYSHEMSTWWLSYTDYHLHTCLWALANSKFSNSPKNSTKS